MSDEQQIEVRFDTGEMAKLDVEEFHPFEPAAYCWDPGWWCVQGDEEFYVSMSGIVYSMPSNNPVGIAPEIKEASDKMDAQLEEAAKHMD